MEQLIIRNIELDKICRICLAVKKEMRPLFGEMVAEMLMEIAKIQIEHMDGWPDKICVQCIHQVSRCHAFKTRVEKSDVALKQYIKGITVMVDPEPKEHLQTEIPKMSLSPPKLQQIAPTMMPPQLHELHIQRADMPAIQTEAPVAAPAMILTSAQLINAGAQIINTGHIITTATGQQIIQTTPQFQAASIGQFIQGPNNTVQMITQNGHPAHVLQIQRTADDRCEIIVQPDLSETQYLENVSSVPLMVTTTAASTAMPTDGMHGHALQQHTHIAVEQTEQTELEESEPESNMHEKLEGEDIDYILPDDEQIETDEIIGEAGGIEETEMEYYAESDCEESDDEEKQIAEFLAYQTSCPTPGRFVCNLCHKEFNQQKWLHMHMSSHTNWIKANCKKQPECEICHKSFRGPGMLRMHMKTHEGTALSFTYYTMPINVCIFNNIRFVRIKKDNILVYAGRRDERVGLVIYKKVKEWIKSVVNKIPTCSICNKEFKSKSILYRHRQTHFEKTFECSMCDKKFSSNYQLTVHEHRHRLQKNYKCPHCDRAFVFDSELENHVKNHLGPKIKPNKKVATSKS